MTGLPGALPPSAPERGRLLEHGPGAREVVQGLVPPFLAPLRDDTEKSIGAAQEAIEAVTEIRWRAERRMGEELDNLPSAQGRRSDPVHDGNEVEGPPTNAELGLSRHEVAGYKALACGGERQRIGRGNAGPLEGQRQPPTDPKRQRQLGIARKQDKAAKMLRHAVPPGYQRSKPPARPKLDGFTVIIDQIVMANRSEPSKRRSPSRRPSGSRRSWPRPPAAA